MNKRQRKKRHMKAVRAMARLLAGPLRIRHNAWFQLTDLSRKRRTGN